jgi:hypothetical protein
LAVQWLNEALCPPQADFCLVDTSETQTTIRITDLLGRVLLNETEELLSGNNTITYNIGEYAAGVYLVHVGNGNTQQVFKVVKE